jgi:hypothetical protein
MQSYSISYTVGSNDTKQPEAQIVEPIPSVHSASVLVPLDGLLPTLHRLDALLRYAMGSFVAEMGWPLVQGENLPTSARRTSPSTPRLPGH